MGRLVDADKVIKDMQYYHDDCAQTSEYTRFGFETAIEVVKSATPVEAIPKADYEARLKADMVAMLEEIQIEIEELKKEPAHCHHFERGIRFSSDIIQQKIDELREGVEEKPKSCSTCRSYKGHAGHCEICHEMSMYKEKENG